MMMMMMMIVSAQQAMLAFLKSARGRETWMRFEHERRGRGEDEDENGMRTGLVSGWMEMKIEFALQERRPWKSNRTTFATAMERYKASGGGGGVGSIECSIIPAEREREGGRY